MLRNEGDIFLKELSIGKALQEEDEVTLYKAYWEEDIKDDIEFNIDDDYLSINAQSAVCFLLKKKFLEGHRNFDGKGVVLFELTIPGRDVRKTPIWNTKEHEDKMPEEWHGTVELCTRYCQRGDMHVKRALIQSAGIESNEFDEVTKVDVMIEMISK